MLRKILIGIVAFLALFIALVAAQPTNFEIARSTNIDAPPATVFAQVNDLHRWDQWSPWAKLDPNMKSTYSGADQGPGAIHAWSGNDQAGEGQMTLLESTPSQSIKLQLDFKRPFVATNMASFLFTASGSSTNVRWSITGQRGFGEKLFCLFVDMDKLVGGDFEKGLAQLKAVAEKEAAAQTTAENASGGVRPGEP